MTEFQPMLDLDIELTEAMRQDQQRVWQHAWCGAVVVIPNNSDQLLACPNVRCEHQDRHDWWRQRLPVAGLRERITVEKLVAAIDDIAVDHEAWSESGDEAKYAAFVMDIARSVLDVIEGAR